MPDENNTVQACSNLRDLYAIRVYMDDRINAKQEWEWGFEADILHRKLSQITSFSHSTSHSFPNELNGLRADSHLFKPDEVGQKIDLPGGLICAHAKLEKFYVHFFFSAILLFNKTTVITF